MHGVGGATPQEMLGDPRTVRITGDEKAAVFRRTDDEHADRMPGPDGDGREPARPGHDRQEPVPEAYCWSNLTSGNSARALWLLLLPFMIANLAHWMRPHAGGRVRTTRLYGVLVRLIALSLTVLMTAAACEVALDLLAWQCAGTASCARERDWLDFFAGPGGGWWSQPGRRLALASMVPIGLVTLLWFLSNRTWAAYESQRPPAGENVAEGGTGPETDRAGTDPGPMDIEPTDIEPTDADADADTGADTGSGAGAGAGVAPPAGPSPTARAGSMPRPALGRAGFWYGRRHVARLRAAHTAAGFLTVAAAVSGAAAEYDRHSGGTLLDLSGRALRLALLAAALGVVWVVVRRGRKERLFDARIDRVVVSALPACALALLGLSLLYSAWSRPGWSSAGTLPDETTFRAIALTQGLLAVALGITAHLLQRHARPSRSVLFGLGGPAVAVLACAIGGVMAAGIAQRVADWLDGPGSPGRGDGTIPGTPVLLSWQASAIPVLLVVLLVPLAVLGVRTRIAARRIARRVEREYEAAEAPLSDTGVWRPDPGRTRRIARTEARATLTDDAPWLVGLIAVTTLLLGAVAVAGSWTTGEVPAEAFGDTGPDEDIARAAQFLGSWLVGVVFILFVTWGRRAYQDASARRTIGILWDVGTYWPRAAHPFAPPCYAERAVPDLTWRVATWTARTGGRLVISGHSQGSVLAASAVWQLPAATRGRVALLTYGSPLERLYGRWFPAYFGPAALAQLSGELDCWRNLWRRTDPIGGPVLVAARRGGPPVDRDALKDPVVYGRSRSHPLPEPLLGHGDYQADPAFARERRALLDRLRPAAVPRQCPPPDGPEEHAVDGPGERAAHGPGERIPDGPGKRAAGQRSPGPSGSSGRSSG
ncbi:hypothetical protein ABT354_22540 [Streptomyces sp. NPDC000594]|uniref:hypothetical protein n=1 Tax=Streptomyces sp. NPDC000594 TaxID=3154261 RepID=UPI0033314B38